MTVATTRKRILHVVGARPNFPKIAPILRAVREREELDATLLHSGQHYDDALSADFFRDLAIPPPDISLGIGSGSHGEQTASALVGIERVLLEGRWDMVLVVGDVNTTLSAALAAAKLNVPVAHVEAGLRSGDRRMPEEVNRVLTDQISDLCLTPSRDADENLRREGISDDRIVFVGNVMVDSLRHTMDRLDESARANGMEPRSYAVATIHRPSNVDDPDTFSEIIAALDEIASRVKVVFPAHPRTRAALVSSGLKPTHLRLIDAVPYPHMLALQAGAGVVLTDSGGMQEETTCLGVPCLTLRSSTERPITITEGTNRLVPVRTRGAILEAFEAAWDDEAQPSSPEGWDGMAAQRIVNALVRYFGTNGRK